MARKRRQIFTRGRGAGSVTKSTSARDNIAEDTRIVLVVRDAIRACCRRRGIGSGEPLSRNAARGLAVRGMPTFTQTELEVIVLKIIWDSIDEMVNYEIFGGLVSIEDVTLL